MRHWITLAESATPFSEDRIVELMRNMDGRETARQLFRLDQGRNPYGEDDTGIGVGITGDNEDEFNSWFKDWAQGRISEKLYEIEHRIQGGEITLYRMITAPVGWKPEPERHPGIYWSWDKAAAQAHWGTYNRDHVEWLITAKVKQEFIEWETTLAMNADYDYEEEKEVRIKEGSPVQIVSMVMDSKDKSRLREETSIVAAIPRMWIGPNGEAINLDTNWVSHAEYVAGHPETFGVDLKDAYVEYNGDYNSDALIGIAEEKGWVRVSTDIGYRHSHRRDAVLLSASSIEHAHRALKWLLDNHYFINIVELDIERVERISTSVDVVPVAYYTMRDKEVERFYKYGKPPTKTFGVM